MSNLIFNEGKPMYTPDLRDVGNSDPLSPVMRMEIMSEVELLNNYKDWFADGNLQEHYQELAMIYATVYDHQIAASSLLLSFMTAITKMEVERKVFVQKKGESEKTNDLLKRNQLFTHVHQFCSAQLEKNKQMTLVIKSATEKLAWYAQENKKLKKQLQDIVDAGNF